MKFTVSILLLAAAGTILPAQINKTPRELEGVGVTERLGTQVDGSLEFVAENGRPVALRNYLNQGRPVILNFVYYSCPMLCSMVLNGVTSSVRELDWTPGKEYEIVTISFDPRETHELAAAKKQSYLASFDRPAPGWHFLTDSANSAKKLAEQVGYQYHWDKTRNQYAHSAALVLLTPEGKVARYLYGIKYKPFDLRMGLTEAAQGRMSGAKMEQMLLYCFQYDPNARSYVMTAKNLMRAGGAMTVFILGFTLMRMWRRDREQFS
ncbi:MAG TPA: SCO family protein [Bryobacteraceae bacterium]|nr:SCO family protein [Bryobacteraceae bacterium]